MVVKTTSMGVMGERGWWWCGIDSVDGPEPRAKSDANRVITGRETGGRMREIVQTISKGENENDDDGRTGWDGMGWEAGRERTENGRPERDETQRQRSRRA